MEFNLKYNKIGSESAKRLIDVAKNEFDITLLTEDYKDIPTIFYGISNLGCNKEEQAVLFEEVLPNTIISEENYSILKDSDYIIMKNPTRLLLWKDAKSEEGTKYLFVKNKDEWRINYAYGKVLNIQNKNIGNEVFGKSHISKWSQERDITKIQLLTDVTLSIAKIVESMSDLKSFGIDIIFNKDINEYLFLELNQAFSMSENTCMLFLDAYLEYTKPKEVKIITSEDSIRIEVKDNKAIIDEILKLFTEDEKIYIFTKIDKELGGLFCN